MKMINLAIIDADSICYLGGKEDSLQQILEKVDYKIQEILTETKADYYVLLISKGKYFRHDISKSKEAPEGSYKANRSYLTQPWVKTIKEYLIVKYKAVWCQNLEADDMAAWLMNSEILYGKVSSRAEDTRYELCLGVYPKGHPNAEEINKILVAKDKDLLYSIPGKHLNFSKKLGQDTWGMEWVETSKDSAYIFKMKQLCIGDNSDGIGALRGVGEKTFEKWLKGWENIIEFGLEQEILAKYIQHYGPSQGIFEFQKNYRLLHMLSTDEDMLREVGYIPQLPEFQQVISPTKEEIKIDF